MLSCVFPSKAKMPKCLIFLILPLKIHKYLKTKYDKILIYMEFKFSATF